MQLQPFRLDMWLDNYEHDIEFNLCSATAIRKPRPGPPRLQQGDGPGHSAGPWAA